jgi:hypothetical protein
MRVGWFADVQEGGVLFDAPRPFSHVVERRSSDRKSADHCPAVQRVQTNIFVVPCAYTLSVRIVESGGVWELRLDRSKSEISGEAAVRTIQLMPRREWRHPDRTIIQTLAPYVFVSDDEVELTQLPAHQHYFGDQRPGILIAGNFPIRDWVRPLNFAFEWHDIERPLTLKRGEPWFYLSFANATGERITIEQIKSTPEISAYMAHLRGVTSFTTHTFELLDRARKIRPIAFLPQGPAS